MMNVAKGKGIAEMVFIFFILFPAAGLARQDRPRQVTTPPVAALATPGPASVVVSPDKAYQIGPSDVIEIQVEDAPELSSSWRISPDGTFSMGFLGVIRAAGKTPEELQKLIADGLRGDYLKDPRVKVIVKQINSRTFFIQGSVRNPGAYQIEGTPSLLELITIAGGVADNHGSTAFVIRRVKPAEGAPAEKVNSLAEAEGEEQPQYELVKRNIVGLLRGNFQENMFVKPGDIVNIPPTDVFFVAGEVNAPGSFALKEGTTLRQAVALAQGTNFKAAKDRGVIFRDGADGKRQEIKVDVGKVMDGKQDDIAIQANDVIIVPNSRMKSVAGALLNAFGLNAARVPIRGY